MVLPTDADTVTTGAPRVVSIQNCSARGPARGPLTGCAAEHAFGGTPPHMRSPSHHSPSPPRYTMNRTRRANRTSGSSEPEGGHGRILTTRCNPAQAPEPPVRERDIMISPCHHRPAVIASTLSPLSGDDSHHPVAPLSRNTNESPPPAQTRATPIV